MFGLVAQVLLLQTKVEATELVTSSLIDSVISSFFS